MSVTSEYLGILICIGAGFIVALVMLTLATILGPKKPSAEKSAPFECGVTPYERPGRRFSVHFYLTAILFILFDVELVFLWPWGVVCRQLGTAGLIELVVFVAVLMAGFFYAWDNGGLDWQ